MADVFGSDLNFGGTGVFRQEDVKFTSGSGDVGLCQNFTMTYSRGLQPIYELGSKSVWWGSQHQAGTISIGRVFSSKGIGYEQFGTNCDPQTMTFTLGNGCGDAQHEKSVSVQGLMLSSISWSGQVGQVYVTEQLQAMFATASFG